MTPRILVGFWRQETEVSLDACVDHHPQVKRISKRCNVGRVGQKIHVWKPMLKDNYMILGAFPSPQLVGFCEVVQQVGFRLPLVCYTFQAICWRSFIVDLIDTAALLRRLVELYPIAGSGILRDVQRLCWMPNPTSEISCRWILPDIIPDLPFPRYFS